MRRVLQPFLLGILCQTRGHESKHAALQVNRLLVVGRDAVHQVAEKFLAKRQKMLEEDAARFGDGAAPPLHPGARFDS